MGLFRKMKAAPVEKRVSDELKARLQATEKAPFGFAPYNPENAEKSGYSNYSYFIEQFKKYTGVTPKAFQKNKDEE